MISLRPPLIVACMCLIAFSGCDRKTPATQKPQGAWSSAPPARFHTTPIPDDTSRPTPATAPLTLDQRLDQVAATYEQRAQIKQMMQQSEKSWQTWWTANRQQLERYRDEATQAADAKDRSTLERIQKEQRAVMVAARQDNNVTPAAVKKLLTAQQQEKLGRAELPLSTVHRAAPTGLDIKSPSNSEVCASCHMRHYTW